LSVEGTYYDGRSARPHPARADVDGAGTLILRGPGVEVRAPLADVEISGRLAETTRVLRLPGGAQFQTDDNDGVDAWLAPRRRSLAHALEGRWPVVLGSLALAVAVGAIFLLDGLPALADLAARRTPAEAERALGREALEILDAHAFAPSGLHAGRRAELEGLFREFAADLPSGEDYRLLFRSFGKPNAFALPGGAIVFGDELIALLERDEEFLAVVAHEIGHQHHRHALRSAFQRSSIVLLVALLFGDAGSLAGFAVAIPTFLLESGYSREMESEADAYALRILPEKGIPPAALADVLRRIDPGDTPGWLDYLSSHPPTEERVRALDPNARADSPARRSRRNSRTPPQMIAASSAIATAPAYTTSARAVCQSGMRRASMNEA
jgi:Zn-dependent protease with chaperone function